MSAKSLPEHLLEQARHLGSRERTRPRQASLRRAVSTAYYALFHLLIREAVRQIGPNLSDDHFNRIYRWFDHGTMYQVAKEFRQKVVRIRNSKEVLIQSNIGAIQFVAELFVDLQEMRHAADYDPGAVFQRAEVLQKIGWIEDAFLTWPRVKSLPECNAFLLSLLHWEKWGKRG